MALSGHPELVVRIRRAPPRAGQCEFEPRPVVARERSYGAAVGGGDLAGDGQPEPGAAGGAGARGVDAEEAVEDALAQRRGDSWTLVGNLESSGCSDRHRDRAAAW